MSLVQSNRFKRSKNTKKGNLKKKKGRDQNQKSKPRAPKLTYQKYILLFRCEESFNKKTILDNFIYKMRFERKDFC